MIMEIGKVHQFAITSATTNAQVAAQEAFENGMDDGVKMRAVYQERRDLLLAGLAKAGFECASPNGPSTYLLKFQKR